MAVSASNLTCAPFAGIVANIVSSFYPSVYYVFLCNPGPRWIYLTGVSICGGMTLAVSLLDVFQHPKWRVLRAASFAALGLFGVVPWGHVALRFPYSEIIWAALGMDALMGAAYLTGAVVYATRIPEKWFPGRFDIFFHSHQIFHMFVVLGAYCHYVGVLQLVRWRDASGGCALDVTSHAAISDMECAEGHVCGTTDLLAFLRHRLWRTLSDAPIAGLGTASTLNSQLWENPYGMCYVNEL
jgi:channel protein (hemolysin III family)